MDREVAAVSEAMLSVTDAGGFWKIVNNTQNSKKYFYKFSINMRILPIQYTFTNNTNNKTQKHHTETTRLEFNQSISFGNKSKFFEIFHNDSKSVSKNGALKLLEGLSGIENPIKKRLTESTILCATQKFGGFAFKERYYKNMIEKIVGLSKLGFKIEDLLNTNTYKGSFTTLTFKTLMKKFDMLSKLDYPKSFMQYFIRDDLKDENDAKLLLEMREKGFEKRNALSYPYYEIEDDEISDLFLAKPRQVLNTIKLLGKDGFVSTFNEKYDNVQNNIVNIGQISETHPLYQSLLELTNPTESDKYLENQELIQKLKSQFNKTKDKSALIKEINDLTNKNKNLIAKSIKDPMDKAKVAHIFNVVDDSPQQLKYILRNCNQSNKKSKLELANILDRLIRTDENGKVCKQLNFKKNKYLTKLFVTDGDFWECYREMLNSINKYQNSSIEETFNNFPLNKNTKSQFTKLGIDYDKWVKFNPNSKIQKEIRLDNSNRKQNVIKNLEEDLSMIYYNFVDFVDTQDKFFNTLAQKGYILKEQKVAGYDENGFLDENKTVLKLYKNNHPVEFDELPLLFSTIKNFMKNDFLWNTKSNNPNIENAKNTAKNHILNMRFKEMRFANQKLDDEPLQITVQKVDMNSVEHALFLGNHSACCTAVGSGCNQWTAPNYIMCKMISAIEVLDGKEPIGNTMCYIAEVDGKPSLILDNIELQAKYQYNNEIRDMLIEYAKQMTAAIGQPDMPIYAGPNRHKVDFDNFELINKDFRIIGSTGKDSIYLDFDADEHEIDGTEIFNSELYKLV